MIRQSSLSQHYQAINTKIIFERWYDAPTKNRALSAIYAQAEDATRQVAN